MKNSKKLKWISLSCVIVGVVLVAISVFYILKTYPIDLLVHSSEMVSVEDLPEPGLLPTSIEGVVNSQSGVSTNTLEQIGTIKIPAIQLSENIVEGSDHELLYGVGHVRGSADLGQPGNCVLAGHRNYIQMHPFRFMDRLKVGDMVYVSTEKYQYTYEIYEILTVEAYDNWVLEPQIEEESMLTLVTCTPVLNPVNRLIAWGRLVETTPLV